jgi:nucleotide-binding universal stress UspA family protein
MSGRAPVVVGVDVSATDVDALEWATAEAAARGCPLTIVHAVRQMLPVDPYGLLSITDVGEILAAAGRATLAEAARRVRAVDPDVELTCRQVVGAPARVLVEESRRARLLVLGGRLVATGPGRPDDPVRRVTRRVVARAGCPVVVVHRGALASQDTATARIVLDLDEAGEPASLIGFAFDSARQRGVPVAAVAAAPPCPGRRTSRGTDLAFAEQRAGNADVPVVRVLLPVGDPAALVAQSAGAAMVVVGAHRRRHVPGTGLGAAGEAVLDRARCPVAVVRCHIGSPLPRASAWQRARAAVERLRSARSGWHISWR